MNCLGSFYLKKHARVKSGKEFHLYGSDSVRVSLSNQVRLFFDGDMLVISLRDKDYIQRIFSSKPADVLIKVKIPGDPDINETVPVIYK